MIDQPLTSVLYYCLLHMTAREEIRTTPHGCYVACMWMAAYLTGSFPTTESSQVQ